MSKVKAQFRATDEYRTPRALGEAMARAANVKHFDLDPFAAVAGYNGIPARERFTQTTDAFATKTQTTIHSLGFNIPFSMPSRALKRIEELAGDEIPVVGIVRADPSCKWWTDCIVGWYHWAVFAPRLRFYNDAGQETTGSPRGGIAIVGRNAPNAHEIESCIRTFYKRAWLIRV